MAKLHLQIDNHDGPYTVSELRRRLARVLSKLDGGAEIRFMFTAALENYTPASPVNRRPCLGRDPEPFPTACQCGCADGDPSLAEIIERNCSLLKESLPKIIVGELARPEND
jgi:hypothetical protein